MNALVIYYQGVVLLPDSIDVNNANKATVVIDNFDSTADLVYIPRHNYSGVLKGNNALLVSAKVTDGSDETEYSPPQKLKVKVTAVADKIKNDDLMTPLLLVKMKMRLPISMIMSPMRTAITTRFH